MAEETPNAATLNVQTEEVQVIQAPARSIPGGGVQTMDGPIRSVPGGTTEQLGGDLRQGANQQGKQDDAARGNDSVDGGGDNPGNGGNPPGAVAPETPPAGEPGAATGADGQPAEAGGEGPQAALQAALAGLSEETRTAFQPFQDAYAANGTLTPEEQAGAATALGVPESLVAFHLAAIAAAQPAEAAQADPVQGELISAAYEVAGSKEAYAPFRAWLESEGRTEDLNVLGDALEAKSPAMLKRLMAPLVAEFEASGQAPNTRRDITAEAALGDAEGAVEGFGSQAEMIEAQRVPSPKNPRKTRYETDPEYRAQVNKRIGASTFNAPRR